MILAKTIAGAICRTADQDEVLDIGAEREADAALHVVGATGRIRLDRDVAHIVGQIGIVAAAAGHDVGAAAAVQVCWRRCCR
jgi:hypothetical protein